MPTSDPFELPLPQSLAAEYAPLPDRPRWNGLFALDAHLAELVRKTTEPLLGQIRLAWWRDRLAEPQSAWPKGNPLLELIGEAWGDQAGELSALVDGWEHVLADPPIGELDILGFANGRAKALQALAGLLGFESAEIAVANAAKRWALADLASHSGDEDERARVLKIATELEDNLPTLPRNLRPLAILDGLSKRSISNNGGPLFSGRRAALLTMRLGMCGR